MIKDESFLDLEESLFLEITPQWNKIHNRITSQLLVAILDKDMDGVNAILETIESKELYKGKTKKIQLLLKTGMLFGGTRLGVEVNDLLLLTNKKAKNILPIATKQFKLQLDGIVSTMRRRYRDLAETLIQEVIDTEDLESLKSEVQVRKANPINIPNVLETKGTTIGKSMINIASSLQMSRVAAYGFSAEASSRGVTTYRISEQLDSRTCPVCREMHGKTFNVDDALRKLDALIRVTDPNDLKLLAPFPKQDKESLKELSSLTKQQLQERGYDTPPFHPLCRGLLVESKKKEALVEPRTITLLEDTTLPKLNSRVAEFLDSSTGLALTQEERQILITTATGVVEYLSLPQKTKDIIESNTP